MSSAFARLSTLLSTVTAPSSREPIRLDIGELQLVDPAEVEGFEAALTLGWATYPRLGGSASLTASYGMYLETAFGIGNRERDGLATEPSPGSKAAAAALLMLAVFAARHDDQPSILLPDPGYPTYAAALQPLPANASFYRTDGDVPTAIEQAVAESEGMTAAIVVVNPGIPTGQPLTSNELTQIQQLSKRVGARLIVDECYIDLYLGTRSGASAVTALEDFTGSVVLHTLSKRSSAPGLRSGFVCGDPQLVGEFSAWNRSCGVSSPDGVNAAASLLWADGVHVDRARAQLGRNWDLADEILTALPGYTRAYSGPFVWLPVIDDCAATIRLWSRAGVRVMPGSFLTALPTKSRHLRLAIGGPEAVLRNALASAVEILTAEALTLGVPT